MKEYRLCIRECGSEHTILIMFRDWGGRQNWQGNATDEEREEAAMERMDERKKYERIFYGTSERDMWVEVREVGPWKEMPHGEVVSESYIRSSDEGSICPVPKASVIFEGQKFTFDKEDSARFAEIVERHLRMLAGIEVEP